LEILKDLDHRKGPGHLFSIAHFYLVLKIFSDEKKRINRSELASMLNLGGGSIRTVLNRLKDEKLIESIPRKGYRITEKGITILDELGNIILDFKKLDEVGDLALSNVNFGCHARGINKLLESGIKLRDEAIKNGAIGATTLIFKGNNFKVLGINHFDIRRDYPNFFNELIEKFPQLKDDDIIIIVFAENEIIAKIGVLNSIFSILKSE